MNKTIERIDEIAKAELEPAGNFDSGVQVASIYGVKSAMLDYHQSRLSELQEQIHGLAREIEDAIESQRQEELPAPDWLKGQLHAYNTAARKIREMMP